MADWSWIGGAAGATTGLIGSILGYKATEKTNESNEAINQRNLDYNRAMTQAQWERDDTAHQREVADLLAAGLSPLAATGGAPNGSPLGAPNPIAMQAPQVDVNALSQSFLGASQLAEEKRHNQVTEKNRSTELDIEAQKVSNQAQQLDIQNKEVEEKIRYQTRLNELASQNLEETIRAHEKDEELRLSAQESLDLERETKRLAEEIARATGNQDIPTKFYYDVEQYKLALKIRTYKFENLIQELGATSKAIADNGSGGINIGTGQGAGFGLNGSGGYYDSENISKKQAAMLQKFNEECPIPVFIDKSQYKYKDKLFKD